MSSTSEDEPPDWPDHKLTARKKAILRFIGNFQQLHGYGPSMREIGEAVGLSSTSAVSHQLSTLQKKGYLRREVGHRPRTVELLLPEQPDAEDAEDGPSLDAANVPVTVIGRIFAGDPNVAEEVVEDTLMLPKQLVGEGELFMLKVAGDSMIDAAITGGDLVVVRRQPDANNGDIVAALIGNEATIKTFLRAGKHVWLAPQNKEYQPINGDDATIMGKIVAVIRCV
jgi:repressor LexA